MWRLVRRVIFIPLFAISLLWLLYLICLQPAARAQSPDAATSQSQGAQQDQTPSIHLTKTVGVAANSCATTKLVIVSANTPLYYCYTVQNTGNVTLTTHTIQDSQYEHPLTDHVAYPLKPGPPPDSVVTLIVATNNGVQQTTISTGTWLAETEDGIIATASDSTTVLVPTLQITETVGTNSNSCAKTKQIDVLPGTKVTFCYTVYNSGKVTLRLHNISASKQGLQKNNFSLNLPPGATNRITITTPVTQTNTNVITWTGYVTDVTGVFTVVTDSATVHTPSITLQATVGTDPQNCATTTSITVTAGTEVDYCYAVTNTGGVTLTQHEINDSVSVTPSSHFHALPPGYSYALGIATPMTETTVSQVKWTAHGAGPLVAISNSQVTVTVLYTLNVFLLYDVDASGDFNDLEQGLPSAILRVQQAAGTVITATTNATGNAIFANVHAGTYTITVEPSSLPVGFAPTPGSKPAAYQMAWGKSDLTLAYTSPPDYNSDCDAIPDRLEGPGDLNQNGIPNYLDANCVYLPHIRR